jgi:hypothetical protein
MAKLIDYGLATYLKDTCDKANPACFHSNAFWLVVCAAKHRWPQYSLHGKDVIYEPVLNVVILELVTGSLQYKRLVDLVTRFRPGLSLDVDVNGREDPRRGRLGYRILQISFCGAALDRRNPGRLHPEQG